MMLTQVMPGLSVFLNELKNVLGILTKSDLKNPCDLKAVHQHVAPRLTSVA